MGGSAWGSADDPTAGPPSAPPTHRFPCPAAARRGVRDLSSLSPGPEVGVVVVFGLTADRNGLADFAIFGRLGGL